MKVAKNDAFVVRESLCFLMVFFSSAFRDAKQNETHHEELFHITQSEPHLSIYSNNDVCVCVFVCVCLWLCVRCVRACMLKRACACLSVSLSLSLSLVRICVC